MVLPSQRGTFLCLSATGYYLVAQVVGFATLTKECTDRVRFQTRQEARSAIFEYLECFYVRSVQPKLTVISEGIAGKETILDNS